MPISRAEFTLPGEFEPAAFVRKQRGRTDLEHLGGELAAVLDSLKAELVEVIHRDYDAFIRLSDELSGTDRTVGALRAHLAEREAELKVGRACVVCRLRAPCTRDLARARARTSAGP